MLAAMATQDTFQLTPPTLTDVQKAEALISKITELAHQRRRRRPKLEAWSFRIEIGLHNDLKDASKKLEPLAMSDIVNGLLHLYLPAILGNRKGREAGSKPAARDERISEILGELQQLVKGA